MTVTAVIQDKLKTAWWVSMDHDIVFHHAYIGNKQINPVTWIDQDIL